MPTSARTPHRQSTGQNKAAVHHPLTGWGRRPCGIRRGDCAICGWRLGRLGISRRARRGCFAGCGQRVFRPLRRAGVSPRARGDRGLCLWTPQFWAARRPLARVVGEEFFVRARCGFAAILDVWQETAPRLWRKRPGEHRRHTGGGWPSQKKSSKTFIFAIAEICSCPHGRWMV